MFPVEGDRRWLLGLGGVDGDSAPTDLDGFLAYDAPLHTGTAHDAIRGARLASDIVRFAFPCNLRRRFEALQTFPAGLLPFGDAICRVNPSSGQGMSIAAIEAAWLDRSLAAVQSLAELASTFFHGLGEILDEPWDVALQDRAYPHLTHARPPDHDERLRFRGAVGRLAARDPEVHRLTVEVAQLMRAPSVWPEPALAARIRREMQLA